jgi:branched-chain amino acid transport system permease protein
MEQILANGLYLGAQYALIALGLTLIFSLMNVLNFAHGQMYVFGGFVTYTVVAQWGLPFIVGLIASVPPGYPKIQTRRIYHAACRRDRVLP